MGLKAIAPLAVMATFVGCHPAPAQNINCAPREAIVERLTTKYGESQLSIALTGSSVIEFFGNTETGSWTILGTNPDGVSCVVFAGDDFVFIAPGKDVEG